VAIADGFDSCPPYSPAYCEQVVAFCRQGYSVTAFAGEVGLSRETLAVWGAEYPEFAAALTNARAASARWWEELARKVGESGGASGSATIITFQLKNMAGEDFTERQQIEHTGKDGGPIETQTVSAREIIASRIAGIAARKREGGGAGGTHN